MTESKLASEIVTRRAQLRVGREAEIRRRLPHVSCCTTVPPGAEATLQAQVAWLRRRRGTTTAPATGALGPCPS